MTNTKINWSHACYGMNDRNSMIFILTSYDYLVHVNLVSSDRRCRYHIVSHCIFTEITDFVSIFNKRGLIRGLYNDLLFVRRKHDK